MTDILSQDEIDALLTAVSSGESFPATPETTQKSVTAVKREKKRLKVYDFRRPDKFSKDQIRTLQIDNNLSFCPVENACACACGFSGSANL